ncbi:competence protein CoiA family protein [Asticcacaulis sp.]|uniref:competence protein CoiA family protein n=1 Tax=Asticcacaulis sp. TaxID=1872648 RepID=UPI002637F828|nr:competence protein CoiA family protein [Asticcacaulis sp.]
MENIKSGYRVQCLECGHPMTWRQCTVRRSHFAHLAGSNCTSPAPESEIHKFGKHIICALINAGVPITLVPACNVHKNKTVVLQDMTAQQEAAFENDKGERRVLDVGCFEKFTGKLVAGIEIWHTHRTEDGSRDGLPMWFELKTDDICCDSNEGETPEKENRSFVYHNCAACVLQNREHENARLRQAEMRLLWQTQRVAAEMIERQRQQDEQDRLNKVQEQVDREKRYQTMLASAQEQQAKKEQEQWHLFWQNKQRQNQHEEEAKKNHHSVPQAIYDARCTASWERLRKLQDERQKEIDQSYKVAKEQKEEEEEYWRSAGNDMCAKRTAGCLWFGSELRHF